MKYLHQYYDKATGLVREEILDNPEPVFDPELNQSSKVTAITEAELLKRMADNFSRYAPFDPDGLLGFDPNLVGFDCAREIDPREFKPGEQWYCPFTPGCGAKRASECGALKERARVHHAPKRPQ